VAKGAYTRLEDIDGNNSNDTDNGTTYPIEERSEELTRGCEQML